MSRAVCSLAVLLALVASVVLPSAAQTLSDSLNCSTAYQTVTTQFVRVTGGGLFSPQPVLQCNSTAYATGAVMYVNESVSTGLLAYSLSWNNNTSSVSFSFDEPVVNGTAASCDYATFQGGKVGDTYPAVISCARNGTAPTGECNVRYNFSLVCAQASPFQLPPTSSSSSSSTGYNAATLPATTGASWLALLFVWLIAAQWKDC